MRKWGKEKGKGVRVHGVVTLVMKKGEGKARGRREDGERRGGKKFDRYVAHATK